MTFSYEAWMRQGLDAMRARGIHRELTVREAAGAGSGAARIDLSSNDYLALTRHPRLVAAAHAALDSWGIGSTSSRLVAGTTAAHRDAERALAAWCGHESALLFSSGYLANLGVVTALAGPRTTVIADAHLHASLHDATALAGARLTTFAHNDIAALRDALAAAPTERALVLIESVYSVLGDRAPLVEIAAACADAGAVLVVDEAHALGLFGAGLVAAAGLAGRPEVIVTATLSKALGSQGGVVLGTGLLREFLVNRARTFMFDTALAPLHAEVAHEAIALLREQPGIARDTLASMRTLAGLLAAPAPIGPSPGPAAHVDSPLISLPLPTPAAALAARQYAAEHGVSVGVFRPPSTPDHVARLRLTAAGPLPAAEVERAAHVIRAAVSAAVDPGDHSDRVASGDPADTTHPVDRPRAS
ncbi:aminotransferase class I/II-fold pyridoxal phosphate-dependent enzyme [Micrococcales bacterium 31B]|nr:aminotransferase class I/II-fold pyridoxal phosphate-dependent enzyme [Micrococcales bacterium 31B]